MLYFREGGHTFATGAMVFEYRPLSSDDVNNRIILRVNIEDVPALAVIDTGAPYLIISPYVAQLLTFDPNAALDHTRIKIRGTWIQGRLHRVRVILPASEGNGLDFEATAFVPMDNEIIVWGDLPTFLGISDCLDRIRFAIDPFSDKLYFGGFTEEHL